GLEVARSGPQLLFGLAERQQRRGAGFGAEGVAEEDRAPLALQGPFGLRAAMLVGQMERSAYGDGLLVWAQEAALDGEPRQRGKGEGEDGENGPDGPAHGAQVSIVRIRTGRRAPAGRSLTRHSQGKDSPGGVAFGRCR